LHCAKLAGKCLLMKIEHVAMYTGDIEALRSFYTKYFQATSNDLYVNPKKGFRSYFLSFSEGARLELMQMESIPNSLNDPIAQFMGIIHIAFSLWFSGRSGSPVGATAKGRF
jgi:lactoylglutathione lyase